MAEQTVRFDENGNLIFDGELEILAKQSNIGMFDYPVLFVPRDNGINQTISMNAEARKLLPSGTKKVFIATFLDYIAVLPDDHKVSARELFSYQEQFGAMTYASALREKKLYSGYYRLHPYRNGFAFNRFEPMDARGNMILEQRKTG